MSSAADGICLTQTKWKPQSSAKVAASSFWQYLCICVCLGGFDVGGYANIVNIALHNWLE